MKHFLMVFITFISPLLPLALLVSLFSVIDTFVGRWYARQIGEEITSRKTRKGLTNKLSIYFLILITTYLIDRTIVNEIMRNYLWFDFAFTRFFASLLIWVEYQSVDEKIKWIKGKGLTDRIVEFGKSLKKIVGFVKDTNPRN
jgi:phage-related holin